MFRPTQRPAAMLRCRTSKPDYCPDYRLLQASWRLRPFAGEEVKVFAAVCDSCDAPEQSLYSTGTGGQPEDDQ